LSLVFSGSKILSYFWIMIKYNNKHWFKFLFRKSGYFHEEMLISILVYAGIVTALAFVEKEFGLKVFNLPMAFHTVLGLVIGLLLVFRTNTAYDRWWEGRKQLGSLVNTCRHLALKSKHYLSDEAALTIIGSFPFVLKEHLRKFDWTQLPEGLADKMPNGFNEADHKPNFLLNSLSAIFSAAYKKGEISGEQLIVLEDEVSNLMDIMGACERIRNTPIPFGYTIHLKRIMLIYLLTLPFGFIKTMGWYSVPFMMIVFYTMIGIELMGEEIEEPFGTDLNDLPFDDLAAKIQVNVEEIRHF
jgi:putative membrane protein